MNAAPTLATTQAPGAAHALLQRMPGAAPTPGASDAPGSFASRLAEALAGGEPDTDGKALKAADGPGKMPVTDPPGAAAAPPPHPAAEPPSAIAPLIASPLPQAPSRQHGTLEDSSVIRSGPADPASSARQAPLTPGALVGKEAGADAAASTADRIKPGGIAWPEAASRSPIGTTDTAPAPTPEPEPEPEHGQAEDTGLASSAARMTEVDGRSSSASVNDPGARSGPEAAGRPEPASSPAAEQALGATVPGGTDTRRQAPDPISPVALEAASAGAAAGAAAARRTDASPAALAARATRTAGPSSGAEAGEAQRIDTRPLADDRVASAPRSEGSEPVAPAARPVATPMADPAAALASRSQDAASGLPTLDAAAPAPASPYGEARLSPHPGSPQFAPALGHQLQVFVREGIQHARLHLNPEDMGPISLRISVDGNAAQVVLTADLAATRQALEQAMPLLASSLREEGLTLTGGGVFEQPRDPGRQPSSGGEGTRSRAGRDPEPAATDATQTVVRATGTRRAVGALDVYA